jgi:hypothetical protein
MNINQQVGEVREMLRERRRRDMKKEAGRTEGEVTKQMVKL